MWVWKSSQWLYLFKLISSLLLQKCNRIKQLLYIPFSKSCRPPPSNKLNIKSWPNTKWMRKCLKEVIERFMLALFRFRGAPIRVTVHHDAQFLNYIPFFLDMIVSILVLPQIIVGLGNGNESHSEFRCMLNILTMLLNFLNDWHWLTVFSLSRPTRCARLTHDQPIKLASAWIFLFTP